jgi:DHA1 family inner membrane transport protein
MLGLYAAGADPVAAVVFLVLMGGALGPVFMTSQHAMLHCAPGRTDLALAANSGSYNAGIAAGAALGGLVLPLAGVRGTFLAGGLMTVGACAVLLGGRVLRRGPTPALPRVGEGPPDGLTPAQAPHSMRRPQEPRDATRPPPE